MFKKIFLIIICFMCFFNLAEARKIKHKKTNNHAIDSKLKKTKSNKSKKLKKRRRHGNGPDLKRITTEVSDFENAPTNGVNDIENDQLYKGKKL